MRLLLGCLFVDFTRCGMALVAPAAAVVAAAAAAATPLWPR